MDFSCAFTLSWNDFLFVLMVICIIVLIYTVYVEKSNTVKTLPRTNDETLRDSSQTGCQFCNVPVRNHLVALNGYYHNTNYCHCPFITMDRLTTSREFSEEVRALKIHVQAVERENAKLSYKYKNMESRMKTMENEILKHTLLMEVNRMVYTQPNSGDLSQLTMARNPSGTNPTQTFHEKVVFSSSNETVHRFEDRQDSLRIPQSDSTSLPTTLPLPVSIQPPLAPASILPSPPPPPPLPAPLLSSSSGSSHEYARIPITMDLLNTVKLQPSTGSPKKIKTPIGMRVNSKNAV